MYCEKKSYKGWVKIRPPILETYLCVGIVGYIDNPLFRGWQQVCQAKSGLQDIYAQFAMRRAH